MTVPKKIEIWGQLFLSSYEELKPFSTFLSWPSCKPQEDVMRSGKPPVRSEWKSFSWCPFFPRAVSWLKVWNDSDCQLRIPESVISTNLNVFFQWKYQVTHRVVLFYILKVFLLSSAVVHLRNHLHHRWRITSTDNMLVWVTFRSNLFSEIWRWPTFTLSPARKLVWPTVLSLSHTHTHSHFYICGDFHRDNTLPSLLL